jgi:hypothetical protein
VLQILQAEIGERGPERRTLPSSTVPTSRFCATVGRCQRFEARGDVDAIPRNVVAVHDDVADVDADPQAHAVIAAAFGFALRKIALNVERALQRGRCAREFGEKSIARHLHETAAMRVDLRLRDDVAQMLQPREARRLVVPISRLKPAMSAIMIAASLRRVGCFATSPLDPAALPVCGPPFANGIQRRAAAFLRFACRRCQDRPGDSLAPTGGVKSILRILHG